MVTCKKMVGLLLSSNTYGLEGCKNGDMRLAIRLAFGVEEPLGGDSGNGSDGVLFEGEEE